MNTHCANCGDSFEEMGLKKRVREFCNKPKCRKKAKQVKRQRHKEKYPHLYQQLYPTICQFDGNKFEGKNGSLFCRQTPECIKASNRYYQAEHVKKDPPTTKLKKQCVNWGKPFSSRCDHWIYYGPLDDPKFLRWCPTCKKRATEIDSGPVYGYNVF